MLKGTAREALAEFLGTFVLIVFGTAAGVSHWASWPSVMGMRSPFDLPVLVQLVPLFVAIPLAAGAS